MLRYDTGGANWLNTVKGVMAALENVLLCCNGENSVSISAPSPLRPPPGFDGPVIDPSKVTLQVNFVLRLKNETRL